MLPPELRGASSPGCSELPCATFLPPLALAGIPAWGGGVTPCHGLLICLLLGFCHHLLLLRDFGSPGVELRFFAQGLGSAPALSCGGSRQREGFKQRTKCCLGNGGKKINCPAD